MCDDLRAVKEQLADVEAECGRSAEAHAVLEPAEPRLISMPVEIILRICSFLDADFLKYTFTKVCRRFETILEDSHIWKFWIHSKINGGCFPTIPQLAVWREQPIDWEATSVAMASEKNKWENVTETMRHIVVKDVHFASVDTVLLVNDGEFCVSGGRDRGMALWRVLDVAGGAGAQACANTAPGGGGGGGGGAGAGADADAGAGTTTTTFAEGRPRTVRPAAHEGWVWDLAPDNDAHTRLVYSASWDNTVKAWDLETGFTCVETFRCGMSALSVACCENVVMAGLYSKRVLTFDVRVGPRAVATWRLHRGPVLALAALGPALASVSEDRTLAVWDRAAGKARVTDVRLPGDKPYPVSVSWTRGALYVGDSRGALHLFHPDSAQLLHSYAAWPLPKDAITPSSKVTGCVQSGGSLLLCSDRGEIKFLYNSSPPVPYVSVRSATSDVTQMRYQNDILVIGTCDSALEFWVPRHMYD